VKKSLKLSEIKRRKKKYPHNPDTIFANSDIEKPYRERVEEGELKGIFVLASSICPYENALQLALFNSFSVRFLINPFAMSVQSRSALLPTSTRNKIIPASTLVDAFFLLIENVHCMGKSLTCMFVHRYIFLDLPIQMHVFD
jgi:hypothetical protein